MSNKCETVIISDKAYNAIIRESFAKHPVETGGIFLGYILDNGLWVVMEMIPPGFNGVFQPSYFEYDQNFVNYLGTSVANQYKEPLQVLGLWHRHPGSMDYFSSIDDGTNSDFASKNPYGVISGLVNIDPAFRLTMYHLDHNDGVRPRNIAYSTVDVEVGDDLIPEKFFALRYIDADRRELNPTPALTNDQNSKSPAQ
ncbi:MAG: Mov34/MPN/PAD-1 family protein [Clostridium sp.]|nr:Mov34/MPN/PAD-1 family protein [Clostridium sp.]